MKTRPVAGPGDLRDLRYRPTVGPWAYWNGPADAASLNPVTAWLERLNARPTPPLPIVYFPPESPLGRLQRSMGIQPRVAVRVRR